MPAAPKVLSLGSAITALLVVDTLAWLAFVPDVLRVWTFAWLNAAIFGMFVIGVASAAGGLSAPIVTQLLYDAEHPDRLRPRRGV